jgi:hypothetical protein
MTKINITLDVSKINKSKIIERNFKKADGEIIVTKDYKIEVVPTKQIKVIAQGDTWILEKTHFVVEGQTKQERLDKVKPVYVGEGFTMRDKKSDGESQVEYPEEEINAEDIPF